MDDTVRIEIDLPIDWAHAFAFERVDSLGPLSPADEARTALAAACARAVTATGRNLMDRRPLTSRR